MKTYMIEREIPGASQLTHEEDDFMTYVYIGGLTAADLALLILYVRTEGQARAPAP